MTLLRRLERIEAACNAEDDVTLEELVLWSCRLGEILSVEAQRRFDDFLRRCKNSRLCALILLAASNRRDHIALPQEPPALSLNSSIQSDPAVPSTSHGNRFWERGHVYEPDQNDDALVPQPGMSLDAFMAHSRNSGGR